MPVFDFSNAPAEKGNAECTYETFWSNETSASAQKPIVVIDNSKRKWKHHSLGMFTNPIKRTSFEFDEEELKGACCDCWGLPKGDGTNGTCEGSSETPFFENGQLKIRFVCKNNEKVVIFEE